jgi:hypothetical protein
MGRQEEPLRRALEGNPPVSILRNVATLCLSGLKVVDKYWSTDFAESSGIDAFLLELSDTEGEAHMGLAERLRSTLSRVFETERWSSRPGP